MIPDIEQLTATINSVYSKAYNQGLDSAIEIIQAYGLSIDPDILNRILESLKNLKA